MCLQVGVEDMLILIIMMQNMYLSLLVGLNYNDVEFVSCCIVSLNYIDVEFRISVVCELSRNSTWFVRVS